MKTRFVFATALLSPVIAFAQEPNPTTPPATVPVAAPAKSEGFMQAGGKVFLIRDGRATPFTGLVTIRVTPEGIAGFDGRALKLPDGHMLAMDGSWAPIPRTVTGLPAGVMILPATITTSESKVLAAPATPELTGANHLPGGTIITSEPTPEVKPDVPATINDGTTLAVPTKAGAVRGPEKMHPKNGTGQGSSARPGTLK